MTALFTKKKICASKCLGERLVIARKKKDLNLEGVEKETKISMKYLYALEHSKFEDLPADIYVTGFLRRYAIFLGLKHEGVLEQYRNEKSIIGSVNKIKRKKDVENKNLIRPEFSQKWLKGPRFFITPELVISLVVGAIVVGLLGYIWFQVKSFAAAPPLELSNNTAEITVAMETINITGKTDSGANLFINNEGVSVDADGSFSQQVKLSKGINTIEITARNKANKETTKTIQVLAK